jgi:hypothetical protein
MGYSAEMQRVLARYSVSTEDYDKYVAGHEAAHAVIAHHYNAHISSVQVTEQDSVAMFSRARTVWNNAPSNDAVLHIVAAGPAYDQIYAARFGIPAEVLSRVTGDEQTAIVFLSSKLKPATSDKVKMAYWERCIDEVLPLLQGDLIAERIEAVRLLILSGIQKEVDVTGEEVVAEIEKIKGTEQAGQS